MIKQYHNLEIIGLCFITLSVIGSETLERHIDVVPQRQVEQGRT